MLKKKGAFGARHSHTSLLATVTEKVILRPHGDRPAVVPSIMFKKASKRYMLANPRLLFSQIFRAI